MPAKRPAPLSDEAINPQRSPAAGLGATSQGVPLRVRGAVIEVPSCRTPSGIKSAVAQKSLLTAPADLSYSLGLMQRAIISSMNNPAIATPVDTVPQAGQLPSPTGPPIQRRWVLPPSPNTPTSPAAKSPKWHAALPGVVVATGSSPFSVAPWAAPSLPVAPRAYATPAAARSVGLPGLTPTLPPLTVAPQYMGAPAGTVPLAASLARRAAVGSPGEQEADPGEEEEEEYEDGELHGMSGHDCQFCDYDHEKRKRESKKKKKTDCAGAAAAVLIGSDAADNESGPACARQTLAGSCPAPAPSPDADT